MASWLGIDTGSYYQITDSLHVYLDDYGAKETGKILAAYNLTTANPNVPEVNHFQFENEPRINLTLEDFENMMDGFNDNIDPHLNNESANLKSISNVLLNCPDEYFKNVFLSMFIYTAHKRKNTEMVIEGFQGMDDSQWKLSCLNFLRKQYADVNAYRDLYEHYSDDKKEYIEEG
jgi:hypothetical protein